MRLRDFGLALAIVGFIGGHLLSNMIVRSAYVAMHLAGGSANPDDLAAAVVRQYNATVSGDLVALAGAALFIVGSVRSRKFGNSSL